MKAYRIANRQYATLDGIGAALYPQRWNRLGESLIYAAESLAVCQLEILVHVDRAGPPKHHVWLEIDIPDKVAFEALDPIDLPRWNRNDLSASRRYGSGWIQSRRTAVLLVPSKAAPEGRNVLINPAHPDFRKIDCTVHRTMKWDARLFGKRSLTRPFSSLEATPDPNGC